MHNYMHLSDRELWIPNDRNWPAARPNFNNLLVGMVTCKPADSGFLHMHVPIDCNKPTNKLHIKLQVESLVDL